jgi:hypothetical protein
MSETVAIEQRLRRFAAAPDDADWQDVLRRARVSRPLSQLRRHRFRWTPRRVVVAVVVVVALAVAAVAVADRSLLGISNHGKRVYPGRFVIRELRAPARLLKEAGLAVPDTARPDTFRRMALRHGIGVYVALSKKNDSLCFFRGRRQSIRGFGRNKLWLDGPGCDPDGGNFVLPEHISGNPNGGVKAQEAWLKAHPFPSPARPVLDMSYVGLLKTRWPDGAGPKPTPLPVPRWPKGSGRKGPILAPGQTLSKAEAKPTWEFPSIGPLIGVAVNRVHTMQVLALSDCHVVASVPVIHNVYIDAHLPPVADLFLVARDAGGKVVWHSAASYMGHGPLERSAPRNCGLR